MANVAVGEQEDLVASAKVDATIVCNADGEKLGYISRLILSRRSGAVECAVVQPAGCLCTDPEHYPIPWKLFSYESDIGVYRIELDTSTFLEAPKYSEEELLSDLQLSRHAASFYI